MSASERLTTDMTDIEVALIFEEVCNSFIVVTGETPVISRRYRKELLQTDTKPCIGRRNSITDIIDDNSAGHDVSLSLASSRQ